MIPRFIQTQVLDALRPGRVVNLFGPRRSGKTVLMEQIRDALPAGEVLMVHGESLDVAEVLSSQKTGVLRRFIGKFRYLFVDEAQTIPHIGVNLKLIVDTIPEVSLLVSGSSAFDLRRRVGEPLVGRSRTFFLYPIAQVECAGETYLEAHDLLEQRLIFGMYPQVMTASSEAEKRTMLEAIRDGYLLKDIMMLDNIKDSLFVYNLLRLIAFQIGNDISYNELAMNLHVNRRTVMRYLELLEQCYILFSLHGYSRNLRQEYTKTPRYYFWDTGMRNALISNYNPLNLRDDVGKLWENYCISERIKMTDYRDIPMNRFFWRTYDQKEIDYLEERGGKLYGYECKWSKEYASAPRAFIQAYPGSDFVIIHKNNYMEYLVGKSGGYNNFF
jgi:predicted AAA+ superfamily ATPase